MYTKKAFFSSREYLQQTQNLIHRIFVIRHLYNRMVDNNLHKFFEMNEWMGDLYGIDI